jgi:ribosomal protein L11 methyltransferase
MGKIRSVDVEEKLRLVPYWETGKVGSNRMDVIIDPGPAFGGGNHAATVIALQLLETSVNRAATGTQLPSMLDVGTGTGILVIAGKRLGTGFSVGLDIDAASIYTARRNLRLNRMTSDGSVEFFVGGVESIRGVFHIVAANLVAPLLLRLREDLVNRVGLFLILSGIADSMLDEVIKDFCAEGLELLTSIGNEGWNGALLGRS